VRHPYLTSGDMGKEAQMCVGEIQITLQDWYHISMLEKDYIHASLTNRTKQPAWYFYFHDEQEGSN
jgi:hypothetical protein